MDARLQQFVMIVNQLDQSDFTNENRQNMLVLCGTIVENFPRISLVVEQVLQLLRSAVQGITGSRRNGAGGTIPTTRCDAQIALVKNSVAHQVRFRDSQDDQSHMSDNMAKLCVDLKEYVESESLDGNEALLIFGKAQAVERGIANALNEFGEMDILVKGVSNEIGMVPDLWRVARKSIGNGTSKDTIDVTLGHLRSDLRRLCDTVTGAPSETVSTGKGRQRLWTDNELNSMKIRAQSFRQKNPHPRHQDMLQSQDKHRVKEDSTDDNSTRQAKGKKRTGGEEQAPEKKSKSDGGGASKKGKKRKGGGEQAPEKKRKLDGGGASKHQSRL